MMYLDLAELPTLFDGLWCWSTKRWAPARWRRRDFVGDPNMPLDQVVRDTVANQAGFRPDGPIRMLTNLRHWGVTMNPVTFYYCFDAIDDRLVAIMAEITNTPWQERHCYVLVPNVDGLGQQVTAQFPKAFHVSPFFQMTQRYLWEFNAPGKQLDVMMKNEEEGRQVFEAELRLERREITRWQMAGVLLRFPWMTFTVAFGIYWQAMRLWFKRTPFHPHPRGVGK